MDRRGEAIAARIRHRLVELKKERKQVADETGIRHQTVCKIAQGNRKLFAHEVLPMAAALRMNVEDLLGGTEDNAD